MVATTSQYRRYKVVGLYNLVQKMRAYHQVLSLGAEGRRDEVGRRLRRIGKELEKLEQDVKSLYAGVYGQPVAEDEGGEEEE